MEDKYEKQVHDFLALLKKLGFPEIPTLPGRYFTFSYSCPVYGKIMLGGKIKNVAYRVSETWNRKRRTGAFISFRLSTDVTEHFGMRPNEDKSEADWQHGMHTLEFTTGYGYHKGIIEAGWSFISPRTHAEVQEYWRLTDLEVKDKIPRFRFIPLVKKVEPGQIVFN